MMNDGKYLEDELEKVLKSVLWLTFHYRRLHDARAAKTKMPAQPADFFVASFGNCFHVECKSQKGKTRRLKKFSQLPDMVRWGKAGVEGWVLVHFHETEELFFVPVSSLPGDKPSWVLDTEYLIQDIGDVLKILARREE